MAVENVSDLRGVRDTLAMDLGLSPQEAQRFEMEALGGVKLEDFDGDDAQALGAFEDMAELVRKQQDDEALRKLRETSDPVEPNVEPPQEDPFESLSEEIKRRTLAVFPQAAPSLITEITKKSTGFANAAEALALHGYDETLNRVQKELDRRQALMTPAKNKGKVEAASSVPIILPPKEYESDPFQPAKKVASWLRMAISGPSKSGKTFSALTIAKYLLPNGRVCLIDTERGSAAKYAKKFDFNHFEFEPPYHPQRLLDLLAAAERYEYDIVIVDSLSHLWSGPGGVLEIVNTITKRDKSGNSFAAWADATPIQNRLYDGLTAVNAHLICTMRTKTEWVIEPDDRGKMVPRKIGLEPRQRGEIEYEFDILGELDPQHAMRVEGSRCEELNDQLFERPGKAIAETIRKWLLP